jgi:hypothetical protein
MTSHDFFCRVYRQHITEQFLPDLSYDFTTIVRFEKHLIFGLLVQE